MKKLISMLVISMILISCAVRLTDDQRNQLKNELVEMVKVDQIASNLPTGKYGKVTVKCFFYSKAMTAGHDDVLNFEVYHK